MAMLNVGQSSWRVFMIAKLVNCFELQPNGAFKQGIPCMRDDRGLYVPLCAGNASTAVPVHVPDGKSEPECFFVDADHRVTLFGASLRNGQGRPPVFVGAGAWFGCIVLVKTFDLDFDGHPNTLAYPRLRNAWPGAEVLAGVAVQVGQHAHADQAQLLVLQSGQPMWLCDRFGRYVSVVWRGHGGRQGEFEYIDAPTAAFADYLIARARRGASNISSQASEQEWSRVRYRHPLLTWTYYAVADLGFRTRWPRDLRSEFFTLQSLGKKYAQKR